MKIIKHVFYGIISGLTMMSISLLCLIIFLSDAQFILTKEAFITNFLASILVGIAFNLPSIVYGSTKISPIYQWIIHMGIGYLVFFPVAYYAKWIPIEQGIWAIVGFCIITVVISMGIWFGFYLRYRLEAKQINQKLKEINSYK